MVRQKIHPVVNVAGVPWRLGYPIRLSISTLRSPWKFTNDSGTQAVRIDVGLSTKS